MHIALSAIIFLSSCNLLQTRDAEEPITNNETNPQAASAEQLMKNFTASINQKNSLEYRKLFSDSLKFISSYYSAIFSSWDKESEVKYFENIAASLNSFSSLQISITYPTAPVMYQGDSAVYTIQYNFFVPHNRTNITQQFAGRSELYLSPKNTIWTIYRWIDFETKKDSSWSTLKAEFTK